MSKVVIITTGGTIAMQHDSVTGAAVPAVSGADLVRAIPGLGSVCDLEVREFDNLPSPAITPDHMFRLAAMVRQYLAMDDVSGVVITHGTDSLEESAYFLDLSLEGHKPVCFTAAMRSGDELSPDGPRNILAAVRVAASRSARNMGSLVVMNEQIHAAREVTKTHAANVATFQSPWWGPWVWWTATGSSSAGPSWAARPFCPTASAKRSTSSNWSPAPMPPIWTLPSHAVWTASWWKASAAATCRPM